MKFQNGLEQWHPHDNKHTHFDAEPPLDVFKKKTPLFALY